MVNINQFRLIGKGVEPNRKFLELMYNNTELIEADMWFDKSIFPKRELDPNMTLDKFLSMIDPDSYTILQLDSPEIRYYCAMIGSERKQISIECPYNPHNFEVVSRLYQEAFNTKLELD